jgi:hypothetical protein
MIHFAMDSNARAIPNVMDGLKPSKEKFYLLASKETLNKKLK